MSTFADMAYSHNLQGKLEPLTFRIRKFGQIYRVLSNFSIPSKFETNVGNLFARIL